MKRARRQRGQSMVEFALILPLFLVLTLAIVDLGWALKSYITVTNSAREGARFGIVCNSDSAIQQRVHDYSDDLVDVADVAVNWNPVKPTPTTCESGGYVEVTAQYGHSFITPLGSFVESLAGGPLQITSTTRMPVE
jgi:Flp pilus assembly protein TadG